MVNESDASDLANATVDDGTKPMDVDVGHQPHIHDYWSGRERVTLMDETVDVDAPRAFMFTFFNLARQQPAVGGTFVEMPDGAIVFEGTGKLEFTATWTDPTVTGVTLRYQHAGTTEYSEPMPLSSGEVVTIDVSPEMTDMPHESTSRWSFLMLPASGQSMFGKVQVKVDIVKMRDIGLFPGHPELFGGAHTLTLFSGQAQSSQDNFVTSGVGFLTGGTFGDDAILSERVVPMETLTMTANVTITDVTTSVGEASDVWFLYKAADTRRWEGANLVSGDMTTGVFQFAWPVEMSQTDSPYADASQWMFTLRVGTQTTGIGGPCGGCSDVKVTYEAAIVAYDARLPEAGEAPGDDDN